MTTNLSKDISMYSQACDDLRNEALAAQEDAVALAKAERRVDLLETTILTTIPATRDDLFSKLKFIGNLILMSSDSDPEVGRLLQLLERDVAAFLNHP